MKKAIYWFRKNLRVSDNPSLKDAIEQNDEVICIYIRDYSTYIPNGLDIGEMGIFRKKFLDESISNLQENLKSFGLKLNIFEGDIVKIFEEVRSKFNSEKVYGSKEVGWYEQDEEKRLASNKFDLNLYDDQFLIETDKLPYTIEGLPLVFTHFRKKVEKLVQIRDEVKISNKKFKIKNYNFEYEKSKILDQKEARVTVDF